MSTEDALVDRFREISSRAGDHATNEPPSLSADVEGRHRAAAHEDRAIRARTAAHISLHFDLLQLKDSLSIIAFRFRGGLGILPTSKNEEAGQRVSPVSLK